MKTKKFKLKEFDIIILKALEKDPLMPLKTIAMLIKKSVSTVSTRLKEMEMHGYYVPCKVVINPKKFGLNANGYIILKYNDDQSNGFREKINAIDGVYKMVETSGNQIIIEILTTDIDAFAKIVADIAIDKNVHIIDHQFYLRTMFSNKGFSLNH